MIFRYDPSNELHGILYWLWSKGPESYSQNLNYSATSSYYHSVTGRYLTPDHAFDFSSIDDNNYWIAQFSQSGSIELTFCLTRYAAKLTGFELCTFNGSSKAKAFNFSSSVDGKNYQNSQYFEGDFNDDLTIFFNYQCDWSKCFKLTCLQSIIENQKPFDVDHIEIYGEINIEYSYKNEFDFAKIAAHYLINYFS